MFEDIDDNTVLNAGDWVKRKNSDELLEIRLTNQVDVFELRPRGRNTTMRDGVTFVAARAELIRNYQKRVD
jgi:hypothetical protein